jgi:ABC-type sugar transport system ATPase subunit
VKPDETSRIAVETAGTGEPVLAARGVWRRFGRVQALKDVTVALRAGEVHAIVGENGAGKSTLAAVFGGALAPDEGTVELRGEPRTFAAPADAIAAGVGIVYQELSLVPDLSVADNVMLAIQPRRRILIDRRAHRARVQELLARVEAPSLRVDRPIRELSMAQGQLVEVAKVLARNPLAVIFDEPTAVLPAGDTEHLLALVRRLADDGVAVGYISHRLPEVEQIADQLTVLRDGALVWTRPMRSVTLDQVVAAMVGRSIDEAFPERATTARPESMLEVKGVQLPGTGPDGISFTCRRSEILGIAGLVGSGRSRIARYLVGLEGEHHGEVLVDGDRYHPRSPRQAIRRGVMLVPEDRKGLGLILGLGVDRNIALPSLDRLRRWGLVDPKNERRLADGVVSDLDIRVADVTAPAQNLSGGNQQKVVVGKWLARGPKLLILDEPLRGIDVNAKSEIHRILRKLADEGLSIILISSELPEVLGLSDRVMVMRNGRIAGVFEDKPFVPDDIMAVATMERA